jgi:hypothetical protein
MAKTHDCSEFLFESGECGRAGPLECFDCCESVVNLIVSAVDDAHAAGADLAQDTIVAYDPLLILDLAKQRL